ncbi:PREDICTED: LOW QUALITY PROTEIN: uncharacterized protein LOC105362018 [Ceratosolen solmsi marchali]|uniref:Zinc finger CCHC domain-containing protein 7 n=1 Tax=Ceratosolen solmsi marchali TaxID=326594 RepID=A0AAJ6YGJ5_9HYME|nr:PREDICTED: LOW QUALITY PROTEIN: uncharacterized protein LOC105362018 [Ceratosolen solmsi marchali]
MDFTTDASNHNESFTYSSDSNNDSDIESRLYAEIHFANIIDGDNDLIESAVDNELTQISEITSYNSSDINTFITGRENLNHFEQTESGDAETFNNLNEKSSIYFERHFKRANIMDEVDISSVPAESSLNKSSNIVPNINTLSNLKKMKKSNKRSAIDNSSNKSIESYNKKSKYTDKSINSSDRKNKEVIPSYLLNDLDISTINRLREHIKKNKLQQGKTKMKMLNPFHGKSADFAQLMDPEFLNLLHGKKLRLAKKAKNRKLKKTISKSIVENVSNITTDTNIPLIEIVDNGDKKILENDDDTTSQKNNTEATGNNIEQRNSLNISEIIDISSESSSDSKEDNFKYTSVATEKKLQAKNIVINDNSEESTSDCQSIFEIPVSPKPTPPVIVLKDSDNESRKSLIIREVESPTRGEDFLHSPNNTVSNKLSVDSESDSVSDMILNCSEIEPHVSNLSEIKKLNKLSNLRECDGGRNVIEADVTILEDSINSHASTIVSSVIKESNSNGSNNAEVASTNNETNNLNEKQKNKDDHSHKNISMEEYFFQPMTNEMRTFYNKSWGGEQFDIKKLKSQMSPDPNNWAVLKDDVINNVSHARRYFGKVCNNCRKPGHKQYNCPEAYKVIICHMCGGSGHLDTSCQNKICLTCGKKQNMYKKTCQYCRNLVCSRCDSQGHLSNTCPDLWRRYHQTVKNAIYNLINLSNTKLQMKINIVAILCRSDGAKIPKNLCNVMKPEKELYCCNCARKGHNSINCRKRHWSQHFQNPPYVSSYGGPNYTLQSDSSSCPDDVCDRVNLSSTLDNSDTEFGSDNADNLSTICQGGNNKKRKNAQAKQNLSKDNTAETKENVNIRIKSPDMGNGNNNPSFKTLHLKYYISPKSQSNKLKNLQVLLDFINTIKHNMQIDFLLKQNNKQINININCSCYLAFALKHLVSQFIDRNTFERSHIYLNCDRDANTILNHLSAKIIEMNNVTECPFELYEKTQQLSKEMGHENYWDNDLRHSLQCSELSRCHQKLLMIIYREGFGGNSLKNLLKVKDKIRFKMQGQAKKTNKLISFNCLFTYLYNYNNVFVPHRPKNLPTLMNLYKERIDMCNRIANDRSVFVRQAVGSDRDFTSTTTQEKLDNYVIATNNSSQPSMEELQPASTYTRSITASDTIFPTVSSETLRIENHTKENVKRRKKAKNLNTFYKLSKSCRDVNKKKKFKTMFETFIARTKLLIDTASKLDAPNIQNEIFILQNKMKDESYVTVKDVKPLKKLVNRLKQNK